MTASTMRGIALCYTLQRASIAMLTVPYKFNRIETLLFRSGLPRRYRSFHVPTNLHNYSFHPNPSMTTIPKQKRDYKIFRIPAGGTRRP